MGIFGWQYLKRREKLAIAQGVREGRAIAGPFHLEIHPADRCNVDCFFCSTAVLRGTDELPRTRFESLLEEAVTLGTRSIRLAGGGEPLFHREIGSILEHVKRLGLRIENITTNGVLLLPKILDVLIDTCDELTISLNTVGAASYAEMMKTSERNYDRVLNNVRALVERRGKRSTPRVVVQFLVWRKNHTQIQEMYDLARSIGADEVLFNGLSGLAPQDHMTDEERALVLAQYRELLRVDELRHIRNISSYEYDIKPDIDAIVHELAAERQRSSIAVKAKNFLRRPGSFKDKAAHFLKMRARYRRERHIGNFDDACIIGWYSMLVRSNGDVGPCCILQGKKIGNIMAKPLRDLWYGDGYQSFRGELNRIREARHAWTPNGTEKVVDSGCGLSGTCPMRSYYYRSDARFASAVAAPHE
jgi:MoaA/NifB/PqqE/SkfB family radical SAM enzyme